MAKESFSSDAYMVKCILNVHVMMKIENTFFYFSKKKKKRPWHIHMFSTLKHFKTTADNILSVGVDPGGFLRGFDLIIFLYLFYVLWQTGLSKQCRPRSDAKECGIWSGSILFTTHPTVVHTFTGNKMDFLWRNIRKSVPNLSKFYHENGILSQKGVRLNPTNSGWICPSSGKCFGEI